jgi:nitrogen regulatory protein P-II 1
MLGWMLPSMKRVEATLSPSHVDDVAERLRMIGIPGMTLVPVLAPTDHGRVEIYRGIRHAEAFAPKARLDIVVTDHDAESVVNAIMLVVKRHPEGDGVIVVGPVEEVIRIRTGETGVDAL